MKLVIDIDENTYKFLKEDGLIAIFPRGSGKNIINQAISAIKRGTPLVEPPYSLEPIPSLVYNQRMGTTGDYCQLCPTNPKNGGNGLCNCTLGTPKIT